MNRPFSAFAALLVLLALAMFAVSSTSRSTTVQPPRQRGGSTVSSRQLGETNFVFIIPAAAEWNELENTAKQGPIAEAARPAGCGMQSAAEFLVKSQNAIRKQASAVREQNATGPALAPARILIAEQVAGAMALTLELDCRADHDTAHDGTLNGAGQGGADSILADAELVSIFRDFGAAQRGAPARQARGVRQMARMAWMRLASQAAAARSWLRYRLGVWVTNAEPVTPRSSPIDSNPLAWNDYAELIDGAITPAAATAVPASNSGVLQGVRFGDWLRHSAASSLLQWGRLLQATAVELEQSSAR